MPKSKSGSVLLRLMSRPETFCTEAPTSPLSKALTATMESIKTSLSFTGTGEPSAEEDVPDEIPGPAGAMGAPTAADASTAVGL